MAETFAKNDVTRYGLVMIKAYRSIGRRLKKYVQTASFILSEIDGLLADNAFLLELIAI